MKYWTFSTFNGFALDVAEYGFEKACIRNDLNVWDEEWSELWDDEDEDEEDEEDEEIL